MSQHYSVSWKKGLAALCLLAVAGLSGCDQQENAAAKVEYAIKKHLTRPEKEALIAAPDTLAQLLPQLADLPIDVVDITKIDV